MNGWAIFGIVIASIIFVIIVVVLIAMKRESIKDRKKEARLKKWKVNDLILMSYPLRREHLDETQDGRLIFVRLVAWNMEEVIVDLPDPKGHLCIKHSQVERNHSRMWRIKYEKAKALMGEEQWKKSKDYEDMKKVKSHAQDILGLGSIDSNNYTID